MFSITSEDNHVYIIATKYTKTPPLWRGLIKDLMVELIGLLSNRSDLPV